MATHLEYGGKNQSPGKSYARSWAYSQISRSAFLTGDHVVIASKDCGDIKFLLDHGVSKHHIWACDVDAEACVAARKLLPADHVYHGDIVKWVEMVGCLVGLIASVNVDLTFTHIQAAAILNGVLKQGVSLYVMLTYNRRHGGTDMARERALADAVSCQPIGSLNYKSWTPGDTGSNMRVSMYQPATIRGLKKRELIGLGKSISSKTYGCAKCKEPIGHPATAQAREHRLNGCPANRFNLAGE